MRSVRTNVPPRRVIAILVLCVTTSLTATALLSGPGSMAAASMAGDQRIERVADSRGSGRPTWLPDNVPTNRRAGMVFEGLQRSGMCPGAFLAENFHGSCSHGPDPAPAGVDASIVPSVRELQDEATAGVPTGTAAAAGTVPCYGDGTSGKRIQAIYAVASDKPDRYAAVVDLLRGSAWNADQAFYSSAVRGGGIRHLRWVTDSTCQVVVAHVVLSPAGDDSFGNTRSELRSLGYTSEDRKYVVFADAAVYCGIANVAGDDTPAATNVNNSGATVARIDSACWSGPTSVAAHEIAHTLGAVQLTAPHSNGAWHCTDEYDRMCYDDGSGATLTYPCASSQEPVLDCHGDDYFNVAPVPGSWLSTHWNVANSAFLENIEPATTTSPPPTTVAPTPSPTATVLPTSTITGTATPTSTSPAPTTSPAPPVPTPAVPPAPAPPPAPTTITTASPTPVRVTTRWQTRLVAGHLTRTFTFSAGSGLLTARLRFTGAPQMRLTVTRKGGQVLLRRTGPSVLHSAIAVHNGTYKVRVRGTAGGRITVAVVRRAG